MEAQVRFGEDDGKSLRRWSAGGRRQGVHLRLGKELTYFIFEAENSRASHVGGGASGGRGCVLASTVPPLRNQVETGAVRFVPSVLCFFSSLFGTVWTIPICPDVRDFCVFVGPA